MAKEPCRSAADCGAPDICHEFTCLNGICVPNLVPAGTGCEYDGYCDAAGTCQCFPIGCQNGASCTYDTDCASGYCNDDDKQCQPSPCGGPCGGMCMKCLEAEKVCVPVPAGDDAKGACPGECDGQGACQSCTNDSEDANETDTDCGGPTCPPCLDGETCELGADCQSCRCEAGICLPFDCGNLLRDGCESDVDCGGLCGSTCAPGEHCNFKQDCASHDCHDGICQEAR